MLFPRNVAMSLFLSALAKSNPLTPGVNTPTTLLDRALDALGGEEALASLRGVTYHAPTVFRSRSLMQSYEIDSADTAVAVTGSQNVSFNFGAGQLQQRIDRQFVPSDYWTWASPRLDRFDFSLVVQGGESGFACYNRGNNQIWLPVNVTSGYTDPALAEYLVLHANMMSPNLLLQMKTGNTTKYAEVDINGVSMPAVSDMMADIMIIFNPDTFLPSIVRTSEIHPIYGEATNDLVLSDFKAVSNSSLLFPHYIQTVYNSKSTLLDATLEDFIVDYIDVNPSFPTKFFEGIPEDQSFFPKAAPHKVEGITHARLTEFSTNMLWAGISNNTIEDIHTESPIAGLPTVHWLVLEDDQLGVKQIIIEFEDGVIVGDAAPKWSKIIIEYVKEKIGKPITHVFPTHHHRDHIGGTPDFVAAGAKLIVPEVAAKFWSNIPSVELITFNDTHPYVHQDANIQAWFIWQEHATHSADWAYAFITTKCPTADSPVIVFEADVWHGGMPLENNDQVLMRQWLNQVRLDGLSRNATVFPTHGQVRPLTDLIEEAGYVYPELNALDWRNGTVGC